VSDTNVYNILHLQTYFITIILHKPQHYSLRAPSQQKATVTLNDVCHCLTQITFSVLWSCVATGCWHTANSRHKHNSNAVDMTGLKVVTPELSE